jgi:hypothetical protein
VNAFGTPTPQHVNSYIIDFPDRKERTQDSFGVAYNFNDKVRSLQYCIPSGLRFRLFQHDGFQGSSYDLTATGKLATISWSSTQGWSSGCFMRTTDTACL